ncbi:MAG: biliverdin-producing heme oxygenase [bacterium]|nr:biliverdin-producing heme oxygenase [bacterium]
MSESIGPERAANASRCPFAAMASGRKMSSVEPEPEPAIGLAQMLKEGTASLHDQAEHAAFQTRMVSGELSRAEFIDFLNQVLLVHRTLDGLLSEAAATDHRVATMFHPVHRREEKIEADIERLGGTVGAEPLASTSRFLAAVDHLTDRCPVALIGVLYVNEGATNGNKVVAKRIRDGLGLQKDFALDYLDPHGSEQRRNWMAFKGMLDELQMTEAERESCLDAAKATFGLFMEMSEEMDSASTEG